LEHGLKEFKVGGREKVIVSFADRGTKAWKFVCDINDAMQE
jgi:hypothetical protein